MTTETWLRTRDPADTVEIPDSGSEVGRRVYRLATTPEDGRGVCDVRSQRRRRVRISSAIAVPLAAVVVVLGLVGVPGPARPPSAAAAVLDRAAAAAGQGQATPGTGKYEYIETETRYQEVLFMPKPGTSTQSAVATAEYDETNQAWISATGTGHHLVTVGSYQFPSAADEAAWNANLRMIEAVHAAKFALQRAQDRIAQPIVDAAGLPTDPSQLALAIAKRKIQVNGGSGGYTSVAGQGVQQLEDGGPYTVFKGAAVLLIGPTEGMTPSLARALFQVMAVQPGATSLGAVTAHDGQVGQGVATAANGRSVDQVIVDPSTGRLLEATFAPPPTSMPTKQSCGSPAGQPPTTCAALSSGMGTFPLWTDVVASGVVSSPTATDPPAGTLRPVATEVPGPPTHLTVTGLLDGEGVHLSWTAPADTGIGPVTDYVVYKMQDSGYTFPATGDTTAGAGTTVTWFIASPGTYFVQAQNAYGAGPASAPVKGPPATPAHPVPPPETGNVLPHGQLSG